MAVSDDLTRLAQQEQELVFPEFNEQTAWTLGSYLQQLASERQLPIAIHIERAGQLLFYVGMPGVTPDNLEWIRRKSNTVKRFHRSSYAVGLSLDPKGPDFYQKYSLPAQDYAAHGGSFPLTLKNTGVIGTLTVSGLKQRADHSLVVEALCSILKKDFDLLALP